MDNPFFTVIVPVYNTSASLGKCLDSILNQSFKDIEVIAVDDGSDDNSSDILKEYAEKVNIFTHPENKGLLCARITGMKNAKGSYILHLDSDDYMCEDALEKLHAFIGKEGRESDIIEYGYIMDPEGVRVIHEHETKDRVHRLLIHEYPPTVWNKCYRREIVEETLNIMEEFYCVFSEDCYFSMMYACMNPKYEYYDEVLMHYVATQGVTHNRLMSANGLSRSIISLNNSWEHIRKTVEERSPENMCCYDEYRMSSVRFLKRQVLESDNSYEDKFAFLKMLDEGFNTQYVKELFDNSGKYAKYKSMGRKVRISECLGEIGRILGGKSE